MARIPKNQRTKSDQERAVSKRNLFRDQFLSWYTASDRLRAQVEENIRFNRGGEDQWDATDAAKLKRQKRPVLTYNLCAPVINFLAGYEWERRTDPRYFPRGTEDEQIGRLATAQAKYAMDIGHGDAQLHRLFRKGASASIGTMYLCLNDRLTDDLVEGDLDFEVLADNTAYWDPYARRADRNDGTYRGHLLWMPVEQAQRQWPIHEASLQVPTLEAWLTASDANLGVPRQVRSIFYNRETRQVRILRHFYREPVTVVLLHNKATGEYERMDSEKKAEEMLQTIRDQAGATIAQNYTIQTADSQTALINLASRQVEQTFAAPEEADAALATITKQYGDTYALRYAVVTKPTTTLRLAHLTAWEILDDKVSPFGRTDEDGEMVEVDWRFPYADFIPYQDTDDFDSIKGVLNDIKDPQREVNWHASTMLDKMVRGHKGMTWVLKGEHADMKDLASRIAQAGFIGEYAAKEPIYIPPPSIIQEEMAYIQMMVESIMRITGINAELMGQTTQKTVSGRAIGARQAGGLVGVQSLLMNWQQTKKYVFELLIRRIQQFYSIPKMARIIGDEVRMQTQMGLMGPFQTQRSDEEMLALFKRMKAIDFDVVVDFQEPTQTARQAVLGQLIQAKALGVPVPLDIMVEASDLPRKKDILQALKTIGEQPVNPDMAKIMGAAQGSGNSQPNGVNIS